MEGVFKMNEDDVQTGIILVNVDEKIINFMLGGLNKVPPTRKVNWEEFKQYCHEFGDIESPNILTVPHVVIDRCLIEVKKRYIPI